MEWISDPKWFLTSNESLIKKIRSKMEFLIQNGISNPKWTSDLKWSLDSNCIYDPKDISDAKLNFNIEFCNKEEKSAIFLLKKGLLVPVANNYWILVFLLQCLQRQCGLIKKSNICFLVGKWFTTVAQLEVHQGRNSLGSWGKIWSQLPAQTTFNYIR